MLSSRLRVFLTASSKLLAQVKDMRLSHLAVANQNNKVVISKTEEVIKKISLSNTNKAPNIIAMLTKVAMMTSELNKTTFENMFTLFNSTFTALPFPINCNFK